MQQFKKHSYSETNVSKNKQCCCIVNNKQCCSPAPRDACQSATISSQQVTSFFPSYNAANVTFLQVICWVYLIRCPCFYSSALFAGCHIISSRRFTGTSREVDLCAYFFSSDIFQTVQLWGNQKRANLPTLIKNPYMHTNFHKKYLIYINYISFAV